MSKIGLYEDFCHTAIIRSYTFSDVFWPLW